MPRSSTDDVLKGLRAFGMTYPGAHFKSPWPGHMDLAVNDKTFAYLSIEGQPFSIGCKLPQSNSAALLLPFTKPTEYGLGKSGWVTATFPPGQTPPIDLLKAWIDESYRAQAPKKLVKQLDAQKAGGAATSAPAAKASPAKKRAAKSSVVKKRAPAAKRTSASTKKRAATTKR